MKLMIVESPNKVRKIKGILGSGWEVAASVGHIRDLPVKELGITMPGYQPQYELSGRGADVVKTLRERAARAEAVYLATDPDREGEAIAWHLSETLKLKNARRVSFDAITSDVILRAIEHPRKVDQHLVHAQEARRVLDRLVGYQVSPVLSRQVARGGLSAGRVQTPAVRLVVDQEREILAFVEVRHFGAELSFDGNSWRAQWETAPFLKKPPGEKPSGTKPLNAKAPDAKASDAKASDAKPADAKPSDAKPVAGEDKYILDEALATRAAACRACTVIASSNRLSKQPPPPPFTTSTMLQAASIRLHWKPDVTAQVAQRLFEAGLITYHRTDSQNFSAEALKEVRVYARERGLPLPASARTWRARGNAQEAHEAIRPTHFATEQAGEDPMQTQLYRLIWLRAVASQLADAEWSVNTTRLESKAAQETFTFKAEGRTLVALGWKALTAKDDADEEDEAKESEGDGRVPVLAVGAAVRAETGRVLHKKTQPPPRYTQASLIKKLESVGIGRPSTYSAILKNVQTRGYLEDDRKFLRPTELGLLVVDALVKRFSFVEYEFTRALEQQLDDIAEGKAEYLAVVSAADERLQRELLALRGAPRINTPRMDANAGAMPQSETRGAAWPAPRAEGRTSWSSRTPGSLESRFATIIPSGATRPTTHVRELKVTAESSPALKPPAKRARTPRAPAAATPTPNKKTGASLSRAKSSAKKSTSTKSAGTKNIKATSASRGEAAPCPLCKAGFVRLSREDAKFYSCSASPDTGCRFIIWRTVAGRNLQEDDIAALCKQGRTGKLSGFTSKAGRPFEAALTLTDEGKVEFSF